MAKRKAKVAKPKVQKSLVDDMKPGDIVYLLLAFDLSRFNKFVPDPTVFLTKASAAAYCKRHETDTLKFTYQPVRVAAILEQ